MFCSPLVSIIVGCLGIIFAILGGVLGWYVFPLIVKDTVADTVAIKNNTDAWDRWEKLPLPMQFKVYVFHIENPDEITAGGKPNVTEMGPYVYTETREKENIELYEDEDRAVYNQRSIFQFDAVASDPFTEEDMVTVVNVPMLSFAQIMENIPGLSSSISMFNTALPKMWPENSVFTTVTVGDYLFKGLPMLCNHTLTPQNVDVTIMCASYSLVHPPSVIIDDVDTFGEEGINSFSFFKYKNNSYDGLYEVRLGIDDPKLIGQVMTWNNSTLRDNWGGETCNKIQGTDSTIFRPSLEDDDAQFLYIYNTDICRTVKLEYREDSSFKDIMGKRYVAKAEVLQSVVNNHDNYCYCPRSVNNLTGYGGCLHDGLLELSSCQGAPVILSFPHFLDADPMYQEMVDGLSPNEELHRIFLDLETHTGSPLRGASRVQMNTFLKPIAEVDVMKNFRGTLLPALWIDEGVELSDDLIETLEDELLNILNILNIVRWLLIAAGIALFVGASGFYMYFRQRARKNRML